MGALREVNDDLGPVENAGPVCLSGDSGRRRGKHKMAARAKKGAQGAADKAKSAGHQDPRHALFPDLPFSASGLAGNGLNKPMPRGKSAAGYAPYAGLVCALLLTPTIPIAAAPPQTPERRPKLLFLVTEDWYFWSHRLPVARAARDAGFEVILAARVRDHGERIRAEGLRLCPLSWRRRGDGIIGAGRAIQEIAALYRQERPDIIHHVALKPVLFGGIAARLAFARGTGRPALIAAVTGLGSGLRWARPALGGAVRRAAAGGRVIVQNPEDVAVLLRSGVAPDRIVLIRGSGVDTDHFAPLPEPRRGTVTIAMVARMLRSKGVPEAVAAVRRLRAQGLAVKLLLAGPTDPDNRDSLSDDELSALTADPGVEWLGQVEDVREVWRRAVIAVMPSTYGEGVPKALLEAAACGRAIVASDMPGCREVVRAGENGLLVPPNDIGALAEAIAGLARDPVRRRAMGRAGRALAEREFGAAGVARQTVALYDAALRERMAAR
jgi:glycosyltransferase involved in cell wall biosynthesis